MNSRSFRLLLEKFLFSEFFKRQGLTSRYDIGELIEITLDNVEDFNYKGTEINENMKVMTKVISPALYLKNIKIVAIFEIISKLIH